MKFIYQILIVVTFMLFIMLPQHAAADNATIAFAPIQQTYLQGTTVDLQSTAQFASGELTIGTQQFYRFQTDNLAHYSLGNGQVQTSATNISFQSTNRSVQGFRIPLLSATADMVQWELRSNGQLLISGKVYQNELSQMLRSTDSLWLIFASHQTDYSTQSINLAAANYSLALFPSSGSLIFPQFTAGQTVLAEQYPFNIQFLQGELLGTHTNTLNDYTHTLSHTVQTIGENWFIATYEVSGIYGLMSFAAQTTTVVTVSALTANLYNATESVNEQATFTTQVAEKSLYVEDALVEYYIYSLHMWQFLGTATTGPGGLAALQYSIVQNIGIYAIKAEITYNGATISASAYLTVTPAELSWQNVTASAIYDPAGTSVTISGSVVDALNIGFAVPLVISTAHAEVQATFAADSFGNFQYTYTSQLTVGSYSDEILLEVNSSNFIVSDFSLPLSIAAGNIIIQGPTNVYATYLSSSNVSYLVTSDSGAALTGIALIQHYTTSWGLVAEIAYNGTLTFSLPTTTLVSAELYRINLPATVNYSAAEFQFTYSVSADTAALTRTGVYDNGLQVATGESLLTMIPVQYHWNNNLNIRITTANSIGLANLLVRYFVLTSSIWDTTETWKSIGSNTSDATGLVHFMWNPTVDAMGNLTDSIGKLKVQISSPDYTAAPKILFFYKYAATITAKISVDSLIYQESATFTFTFQDQQQPVAQQNFSVTIGDFNTTITTDAAGSAQIEYTPFSAQPLTVDILYLSALDLSYPFPYMFSPQHLQFSVQKAQVILIGSDSTVESGTTASFSATVYDLHGAPAAEIYVELWDAGVRIASTLTDAQGHITVVVTITESAAATPYQYIWKVPETANYLATFEIIDVYVATTAVTLNITHLDNYAYNSLAFALINAESLYNSATSLQGYYVQVTIPEANYTSPLLTIDSSNQINFTMPAWLHPGNYSLIATFDQQSTYSSAIANATFSVEGVPIHLVWENTPYNYIYGSVLDFGFYIVDSTGTGIANFDFTIHFADLLNVYGTTDAAGYYFFNETLRLNATDITITITSHPNGGYDPLLETYTITQTKSTLSVIPYLSTVSLAYSDFADLSFTTTDEYGNIIGNVYVDVYLQDSASQVLIYSGYSSISGVVSIRITQADLPFPVGAILNLVVILSHPDYALSEQVVPAYVNIVQEILQLELQETTFYYYQTCNLSGRVVDNDGASAANLQLIVEYTPNLQYVFIGNFTTDAWGYFSFTFTPVAAGDVVLSITVVDPQYRYEQLHSAQSIFIEKTTADLNLTLTAVSASPAINASLTTADGIAVDGQLSLLRCAYVVCTKNYQWEYLYSAATTNGSYLFILQQVSSSVLYKVEVAASESLYGISQTIVGEYLQAQLLPNNFYVQYSDVYNPLLQTNVSTSLQVHLLLFKTTWIDLGIIYFNGSEFNSAVTINEMPGQYLIKFSIEQYGWIQARETVSFELTIDKEEYRLSNIDHINVARNATSTHTFILTDDDFTPLSGSTAKLYFNSGDFIASGTSTANGELLVTFFLDVPTGNYSVSVVIAATEFYNEYHINTTIVVKHAVSIIPQNILVHVYTDGFSFQLLLTDTYLHTPIAGKTVFVRLINAAGVFEQITYSNISDVNGIVTFSGIYNSYLSNDLLGLQLYFYFIGSLTQFPQTTISPFYIEQETVHIGEMKHINYGITFNQTVWLYFYDESGNITSNQALATDFTITVTLYRWDGTSYVFDTIYTISPDDSMALVVAVLSFDQVGKYKASLQIISDVWQVIVPYELFFEQQPVGLHTQVPQEISQEYLNLQQLNFTITSSDDTVMQGIYVELRTPWGVFSAITSTTGYVKFVLPYLTMYPGNYSLQLIISHDTFLNDVYQFNITVEILQIQKAFTVDVADIYADEHIYFRIMDDLNSSYYLQINSSSAVIFEQYNLSQSDILQIIYQLQPPIDNYTFQITRQQQYYVDFSVVGTFLIQAIPVDLQVAPHWESQSYIIDLSPFDSRTSQLLTDYYYEVIVSNSSGSFPFYSQQGQSSFVLWLDRGNPQNITITLLGNYEGTTSLSVPPQTALSAAQPQVSLEVFGFIGFLMMSAVVPIVKKKFT